MTSSSTFTQLPEPLPEPIRLAGILLVAQALLRLALLAMPMMRFGLFINIFTVISLALAVGGIAAGVLALQRFALARGFGLAFCAVALLYQLYGVGTFIFAGSLFRLPLTSLFLILVYTAIYAACLVIFAQSPYYKADPIWGEPS
jgi:hypothetical protein